MCWTAGALVQANCLQANVGKRTPKFIQNVAILKL